jgi:hypothetical protein
MAFLVVPEKKPLHNIRDHYHLSYGSRTGLLHHIKMRQEMLYQPETIITFLVDMGQEPVADTIIIFPAAMRF